MECLKPITCTNYIDLLICCAIIEGEKALKPIKLSKGVWNVKSTCYYQIYLYEILFLI